MRKPIKPFAVETRRTGRTPLAKPARLALPSEDEPKSAAQPEWPPMPADDDSYVAAMRAADALFSRPAPEPERDAAPEAAAPTQPGEPPRRILQSLNEDDHISRLLAEEDEDRPRRGRKPRQADEDAPLRISRPIETPVAAPSPELALAQADEASPGDIPGYVRGEIYGRYARHDRTRPGEHWRKRGLKPLW